MMMTFRQAKKYIEGYGWRIIAKTSHPGNFMSFDLTDGKALVHGPQAGSEDEALTYALHKLELRLTLQEA